MLLTEAKQEKVILDGKEISISELNRIRESVASNQKIKEIIPNKEYKTISRLLD